MLEALKSKLHKKINYSKAKCLSEHEKENSLETANNINFHPVARSLIDQFKASGGVFNRFALTESAMRALLFHLLQEEQTAYNIIELGGGQSTLFFHQASQSLPLNIHSFEHDKEWHQKLCQLTENNQAINVYHAPLQQITEAYRNQLMSGSEKDALKFWQQHATNTTGDIDKDTRARNCFYSITNEQRPKFDTAHALIVDGPHGNGRSMSFSIFQPWIKTGSLILVDDYHHYPFLDELNSAFNVEIIEERRYRHSNKGWALAKVLAGGH